MEMLHLFPKNEQLITCLSLKKLVGVQYLNPLVDYKFY